MTTQRADRVKQIAAYDRNAIEHYIHLVNVELLLKKNLNTQSLLDLLEDLTLQKNILEQQWKNQLTELIFSLFNTFKNENQIEGKETNKIFKDIEIFQNALGEIKILKEQLASRDEIIQIQKEQLNFSQEQFKKLEEELQKQKQIIDVMSKENISKTVLARIIKKYEKYHFSYFSHAPDVLQALKLLCLKADKNYFSKFDVQACFKDPKGLFLRPPSVRRTLSQREHLICELADAFVYESGALPELKYR